MKNSPSNSYRIFSRWAAFSYQNAVWIILLVLLLTSLSTVYTVNNLGVHTDTTDMLSEDAPFRANNIHYKKSFSQYEDTFLLVMDAPTPEQAHQAAKRFTKYLQKDSTQFSNTYYLMGEPFFEQNGLFFKSQFELGRIADYLAAAQPLVARIAVPEAEAPKGPAATAVTAVKATATPDGIIVSVMGNGALSPKVFPAEKGMKLVSIFRG